MKNMGLILYKLKVMFHFIFFYLLILQISISSKFFRFFWSHIMRLLQGDIHFRGDDEALDAAIDVGAFVVMSNGGGIFVTHVIHGKGDALVVAIIIKFTSFNVVMGSPSSSCNISIGPFSID
jgi:hypothetical protein